VARPGGPGASAIQQSPPGKGAAPTKSGPQPQLQIGSYRILERIGAGGMGTVYKAVHVELDRIVALKVMPPEMNNNPTNVARFKREAKAAAQLQHENIVQIYDVSEDKGRHYLALEFIKGRDLSDIIAKKKMLPAKESVEILKGATNALQHAFEKGIVHRDIKPSNFLITENNVVKLCDMGLALRADAGEESKVTRDGTTVGTVDYMSPEQARDSRLADTRSDIYSLGCTLYQMLTGRTPFEEGSIPEKLFKHASAAPPDPLQFNPEIPPAVLYIMNKMLEKKAEDRYQNPKDLLADLNGLDFGDKKPGQSETAQALAAGLEAEPTDEEQVVLKRHASPLAKKKEQQAKKAAAAAAQAQQKKLMIIGGSAAAGVLVLVVVGVLMSRGGGGDKPPDPGPGPAVNNGSGTGKTQIAKIPPPVLNPEKDKQAGGADTKPDDATTKPDPDPDPDQKTKPAPDEMTKPEVGPAVKNTDPQVKPEPPRVSPEDRKRLEAELLGDPWTDPIPGAPVTVARAVQAEGVFGKLEFACTSAKTKATNIEIEDNGPNFERSFKIDKAKLEVRPRVRGNYKFRPVIVFDALLARKGTGSPYFIQATNSKLAFDGIDFVVNAGDLTESIGLKPFALFDIQGGDISFKDCTFTVLGKHSENVSLVHFFGAKEPDAGGERTARLGFENCFGRGEALTIVTLNSALADVKVVDSLFVGGLTGTTSALFDLRPPGPNETSAVPQRTLRFVRSSFACTGDFIALDGAVPGDIETSIIVVDSIAACAVKGATRRLVKTKNWPEQAGSLAKVKIEERSAFYTGWGDNLLTPSGGAKVAAKTPEQWVKAWKLEKSDSHIRNDNWPTEPIGELARATAESFDATAVAAGIKGRFGENTIGCIVDRLPRQTPMLAERSFARFSAPDLVAIDKMVPSFLLSSQKNRLLDRWRTEQVRRRGQQAQLVTGDELDLVYEFPTAFNVNASGDLGKFIMSQVEQMSQSNVLIVTGSGTHPMTPVKLAGKSLILWFQPTAGPPLTLVPAAGSGADVLIEVQNGDLVMENANIAYPSGAATGLPRKFIKVDGGNLTLSRCRLIGPLQGDTAFQAIELSGGKQGAKPLDPAAFGGAAAAQSGAAPPHLDFHPAGHERSNVCQLLDCFISAEAGCIKTTGSRCVLRVKNCVGVTAGVFAAMKEIDRTPTDFESALVVEESTIAASKSILEVGEWLAGSTPGLPLVVYTRDNLFCDPFEIGAGAAVRPRAAAVLRYDGKTLQQGLVQWESTNDGYTHELFSFLVGRDDEKGQRQKFDQDWVPIWGRPHIVDAIVDATRADNIKIKGSKLKLKDFERDRDLSVLQVVAGKKASHGGAIGADLTRIP
jgi:serine/threonine-protein kinase